MANEAELISNPDNTPGAVSTGYQAQNTRALAASNGIDNSSLSITGAAEITLSSSGGIDVNGSLYSIASPVVFSLVSFGRYFVHLVGSGSNLTPSLVADEGVWNPELNGRYNASNERILNWVINYSAADGFEIEKLLTPSEGRNVFIEHDVQPETLITSSTTWTVPRTKYYKFKLQAKGGNGGNASNGGGTSGGGGGGGGAYGEVILFLTAGTVATFTFNTGSGALTQFQIGAIVYSVQNGSNGGAAIAASGSVYGTSGAEGSTQANMDFVIHGEKGEYGISGSGGGAFLGKGALSRYNFTGSLGNGLIASNYGGGGGGAYVPLNGSQTGGAGASGCCIIVG